MLLSKPNQDTFRQEVDLNKQQLSFFGQYSYFDEVIVHIVSTELFFKVRILKCMLQIN